MRLVGNLTLTRLAQGELTVQRLHEHLLENTLLKLDPVAVRTTMIQFIKNAVDGRTLSTNSESIVDATVICLVN